MDERVHHVSVQFLKRTYRRVRTDHLGLCGPSVVYVTGTGVESGNKTQNDPAPDDRLSQK